MRLIGLVLCTSRRVRYELGLHLAYPGFVRWTDGSRVGAQGGQEGTGRAQGGHREGTAEQGGAGRACEHRCGFGECMGSLRLTQTLLTHPYRYITTGYRWPGRCPALGCEGREGRRGDLYYYFDVVGRRQNNNKCPLPVAQGGGWYRRGWAFATRNSKLWALRRHIIVTFCYSLCKAVYLFSEFACSCLCVSV